MGSAESDGRLKQGPTGGGPASGSHANRPFLRLPAAQRGEAMKKRKVNYPAARTATRTARGAGPSGDRPMVRPTVAEINLRALDRRGDLAVGDFVRIGGGGLYAGELAVVDSVADGIIPAAIVRTEAGKARRVRVVDLEPVTTADGGARLATRAPLSD